MVLHGEACVKSTWSSLIFCGIVIYFGIVHSLTNPGILLNMHAVILVIGGTISIAFLSYHPYRLMDVVDYILFGFLFRYKKTEKKVAQDLISYIDSCYHRPPTFPIEDKVHPFLRESFDLLNRPDFSAEQLQSSLMDRRNSIKRRYIEDAKILNNIAKYPPHLGLLGAASGMIEMMSALGKAGIDSIGGAMAVALSATLWGVGLNNFVFLPLSDHSMKVSEDEIYLRDIIIACCLMIKNKEAYEDVIATCLNKLSIVDRNSLAQEYNQRQSKLRVVRAA